MEFNGSYGTKDMHDTNQMKSEQPMFLLNSAIAIDADKI